MYKVVDKKGETLFESESLESCLHFCRLKSCPLKVFKGKALLAYKSAYSPQKGRPRKNTETYEDE